LESTKQTPNNEAHLVDIFYCFYFTSGSLKSSKLLLYFTNFLSEMFN